jgi:hypothetical protein
MLRRLCPSFISTRNLVAHSVACHCTNNACNEEA